MKRRDRDRIEKVKYNLRRSRNEALTPEERKIREKNLEKLKKELALPIVLSDYPYSR